MTNKHDDWKTLYRVGGIAPLVSVAFYLTEMFTIILGGNFPESVADWYLLFERNRLLGLVYLNALDIFSVTLASNSTVPLLEVTLA